MRDLQAITRAYVAAMIWADLRDEDDVPLDEYTWDDLSPQAKADAEGTCASFLVDTAEIDTSEWTDEQLGHDLWLTSQGHGTGFWDRGWKAGTKLTDVACTYRTVYPYDGDDGLVYIE